LKAISSLTERSYNGFESILNILELFLIVQELTFEMSTHAVYYTIVRGEILEVITVTPVICYLINYSIKSFFYCCT